MNPDELFAELDGLEWLEQQIAVCILQEKLRRSSANSSLQCILQEAKTR
jgi:hypothetical protein